MHKLHYILSICFLATITTFAQVPQAFSYQGLARDAQGNALANKLISIKASILNGSATGTVEYAETQTATTNATGLFTLGIGNGTASAGTFSTINWATGNKYLKIEFDPNGGTNYVLSGTTQMLSVPYAQYAAKADWNNIQNKPSTISGNGFTHYVGELFGGGIVFHVYKDATGEHGLIAALTDQSTATGWSNVTATGIGISAQSLWDGSSNTIAIINQSGHTTSAAAIARAYNGGGFNDWYLPSIFELAALWKEAFIIQKTLSITNGTDQFLPVQYSSSTESYYSPSINARAFNFHGGTTDSVPKNYSLSVRAVRAF